MSRNVSYVITYPDNDGACYAVEFSGADSRFDAYVDLLDWLPVGVMALVHEGECNLENSNPFEPIMQIRDHWKDGVLRGSRGEALDWTEPSEEALLLFCRLAKEYAEEYNRKYGSRTNSWSNTCFPDIVKRAEKELERRSMNKTVVESAILAGREKLAKLEDALKQAKRQALAALTFEYKLSPAEKAYVEREIDPLEHSEEP